MMEKLKTKILERNDILIDFMTKRNIVVNGSCKIQKINKKVKREQVYYNICLQDVSFIINDIKYYMQHIWLQEEDYENTKLRYCERGEFYNIRFSFYEYRFKNGYSDMHGITVYNADRIKVK